MIEAAESVSAHTSIKLKSHTGVDIPEGHEPGGSYTPDLTLHDFLHVDEGNEHKVEGIGDSLASGTAEMLLAMFEHHGIEHKLRDLARTGSGHELATSFIDLSVLEEHGLSQHELSTVHAIAGSMNERIFEKLKRGDAKPGSKTSGGDSYCPTQPELDEEGGSSLIADSVSSDKGASDKYAKAAKKPSNYDPSAVDVPDPAEESRWQNLQMYTDAASAKIEAERLARKYGDPESDKYRKLTVTLAKSTKEESVDVVETIVAGMSMSIFDSAQQDTIAVMLEEVSEKAGVSSSSDDEEDFARQQREQAEKSSAAVDFAAAAHGIAAVKELLKVFTFVSAKAQSKMDEIIQNDPKISSIYEEELEAKRKSEDAAEEGNAAPDDSDPKAQDALRLASMSKPGVGQQIKDLMKKEWEHLKQNGGQIVALLTFLKIGVSWALPITIGAILNPSLPGIGLVCQPIAPCISHIVGAAAAIMKTVWQILTIPIKVLWICVKAILEKIGGPIIQGLLGSNKKAEAPTGTDNEGAEVKSGGKGFSAPPFDDKTAPLVPASEARGKTMAACKLCNLRLIFSFTVALTDCLFGFGIAAFKIILATVPQPGPTLLKCGGACLKLALSALKPNSAKDELEKSYWQETCTPHSVGMCLLNARATQCGAVWKTGDPKTDPLSRFINAAQAHGKKGSGIRGVNMCENIPDSVQLSVARARSGRMVCPGDAVEVGNEWSAWKKMPVGTPPPDNCNTVEFLEEEAKCNNGGCSNRVFSEGACATMSLKKGCNHVRDKMIKLEKKSVKTCGATAEWGHSSQFTREGVPAVDILFEQCVEMMGCAPVTSIGGPGGAGGLGDSTSGKKDAAKKMDPQFVLDMIEKHMDSMDYLSGNNAVLKTPKEASTALFKDLQKAMDADTMFTEQKAAEASTCEHDWKLGVGAMWRHPLWSGRCVVWERPPVTSKFDLINGLLEFTVDPSLPKEKITGSSDSVSNFFKSKEALDGDEKAKEQAMKDTYLKDLTMTIAKESENIHGKGKNSLCRPQKDGHCTFLSAMMEPPVPMQQGQVVNRGLLLADVMGVSTTNAMWCDCECCSTKFSKTMSKSETQAGNVCKLEVVGRKEVGGKEQCTTDFCNLRFGQKCLGKAALKGKKGDTKATFRDLSNAAKTCAYALASPLKTEVHLKDRAKFWLEQHRTQRLLATTCIRDVATSNMGKAIEQLTTARPSLKEGGAEYLQLFILDGSKPILTPSPTQPIIGSPSLIEMTDLATFAGYAPPPLKKDDPAGWTERRCTGCCSDKAEPTEKNYKGEPVDPEKKRSCNDGKKFSFSSNKAKLEQCQQNCPSQAEKVAAEKEAEEVNMVKNAAAAAKSAQESGKLVIRLCTRPKRVLPSLNLGNKVFVAFPTSINIASSSVNAFIVTRAPYFALSRTSQMARACMELDTSEPLDKKTWCVSCWTVRCGGTR
jgi:hypothetical protein